MNSPALFGYSAALEVLSSATDISQNERIETIHVSQPSLRDLPNQPTLRVPVIS